MRGSVSELVSRRSGGLGRPVSAGDGPLTVGWQVDGRPPQLVVLHVAALTPSHLSASLAWRAWCLLAGAVSIPPGSAVARAIGSRCRRPVDPRYLASTFCCWWRQFRAVRNTSRWDAEDASGGPASAHSWCNPANASSISDWHRRRTPLDSPTPAPPGSSAGPSRPARPAPPAPDSRPTHRGPRPTRRGWQGVPSTVRLGQLQHAVL